MQLRTSLHRLGYRFRVNYPVPGRPRRTIDIAFTRHKVAVFVDGCFWHACPEHATWPRANSAWWRMKLQDNSARDVDTTECLQVAGWTVVRVWEHSGVDEALNQVVAALPDR
jgi:DNA mismatch endonuclease (patch repair protein)